MAGPIVGELLLNNKSARNHKMIEKLKVELKYPRYSEGLAAMAHLARKKPV
jgi:hypothetical protein